MKDLGLANVGPSTRARIVERRTYLRPLNEEGTVFETPDMMLDRVVSHQRWLWERQIGRSLNALEEAELFMLRKLMENRKISMSGRVKWMGFTDVAKDRHSSLFNCSFTEVRSPADLVDVFWLLLQGCGVGFKPVTGLLTGFSAAVEEIEVVPSTRTEKGGSDDNVETYDAQNSVWTIKVGDSAKSWAKAIGKLLAGKFPARKLVIDLSELRPAGKRLKGYGWLSSGWKPLEKAMRRISELLMAAACRTLTALEIGDIVNHLGTVLSSRRSAQIWLMDDFNEELTGFVDFKEGRYETGNEQREQSNNSIVFWQKPSAETLTDLLDRILRGGEPGFINGSEAKRRAPEYVGCNPCAEILLPSKGFCVAGNTPVITRRGLFEIKDLVGKEVEIWNGQRWSKVSPYQTGDNVTLFRITANDGSELVATANHRWQVFTKNRSEAWAKEKELEVTTLELIELLKDEKRVVRLPDFTITHEEGVILGGDMAYTAGVFMGDGSLSTANVPVVDLYGDKRTLPVLGSPEAVDRHNGNGTPFRRVRLDMETNLAMRLRADLSEVFSWSGDDRRAFLAGMIDTDGSATGTGGVRLYVGSRERADQVQLLLRTIGLRCSVNRMVDKGDVTNFGTRKSAIWYIQITDARGIPCHRVDVSGGHTPDKKGRYQIVKSVERLENTGPSYCLTEPEFGMCVFGNMLTYQCNLVQVIWHRFNGDLKGLLLAQRLAGRANYRQTCVNMKDGVLQLSWDDNQHLLRLCGVAPLGYVSWEGLNDPVMLEQVAKAAIDGANSMADEFGTPRPRRVTQVQPGGTSSKHMGLDGDEVHEGAHLALSRWIFNNINVAKSEPLVDALRDANYHIIDHPFDPNAVLVRVPVEYPASPLFTKTTMVIDGQEEEVEVNTESAIGQLERYRILMEHYVEHNCSITVSFDETEIPAMVDWFDKHWDSYVGVSFLRRNDPTKTAKDLGFAYLPQEAVSRRMYEEYVSQLLPLDLSADTSSEMLDMEDCATGACPAR